MNFLTAFGKMNAMDFCVFVFWPCSDCKWHFCVIVGALIEGFYGLSLFGNGLMVEVDRSVNKICPSISYFSFHAKLWSIQYVSWSSVCVNCPLRIFSEQLVWFIIGNLTKTLRLLLASFSFCFVCDCYFHSLRAFSFLQHDILSICVKRFRTGHKKSQKN